MSVSIAGLIGAAIGAYLGWLDGKIFSGILLAAERKAKDEGTGNGILVRHGPRLRALGVIIPLIGFPVIGYWAGSALAG